MYKIYDETDMGQHPIYNINNINISLILHLLDWLMGRDKVYKGTAYHAGQLVEAPQEEMKMEEEAPGAFSPVKSQIASMLGRVV